MRKDVRLHVAKASGIDADLKLVIYSDVVVIAEVSRNGEVHRRVRRTKNLVPDVQVATVYSVVHVREQDDGSACCASNNVQPHIKDVRGVLLEVWRATTNIGCPTCCEVSEAFDARAVVHACRQHLVVIEILCTDLEVRDRRRSGAGQDFKAHQADAIVEATRQNRVSALDGCWEHIDFFLEAIATVRDATD